MTMDDTRDERAAPPHAGADAGPGEPAVAPPSLGVGVNAFERALAQRAFAAHVEGRGALALLIVAPDAPPIDAGTRRWLVQAAQDAGFTHVALEVSPDPAPADAALPGHYPA